MLERMWEKAEILLSSPGFVLATDRNNELSRQVASLSDQKNKFVPPHYVCAEQCKVGMEVKCNCPVYKSTPSICQHTLAAAQDMMILPQYITWVRKTKSLNLSQLIADSVPQSGWKKSTVCRKAAPRKQLERDNTVSHSQQPQPSASLGVSAPLQLTYSPVTVQKVSSSQLDVTAPVSQLTYSPVTVQNVSSPLAVTNPPSQVSYSPMMSTSGPWFNQFLRPMYPFGLHDQSSFPSFASSDSTEHQCPSIWIHRLEGTRIRTCYDCNNPIRLDTNTMPEPPHDLVFGHKERRWYRDPHHNHEMKLTTKLENVYYHLFWVCVKTRHPGFTSSLLHISEEIRSLLTPAHKIQLCEQFNLFLKTLFGIY